ncbi:hypothetical protein [Streptomyces sp. SLBN-8D4]|uniref:hypothetical protein n=1 Tax=Streptomyces sp. SLBN-8D4 TaxID=3377728 RepID=UPI003C7E9D70
MSPSAVGKIAVGQLLRDAEDRRHGLFARDGRRLECAARDTPTDVLVPGTPVRTKRLSADPVTAPPPSPRTVAGWILRHPSPSPRANSPG